VGVTDARAQHEIDHGDVLSLIFGSAKDWESLSENEGRYSIGQVYRPGV